MSNRVPITRAGAVAMKNEVKRLKAVERPKVIAALEEARAHGDLSENADYDAAKNHQAFIEGRIAEIEGRLAQAEIIDISRLKGDKVVFGATVTLADEEGAETVYQIVGDWEADIKVNKLAITSPIARAMIGREVGDTVTVRGPRGGEREFEILSVAFLDEAAEEA